MTKKIFKLWCEVQSLRKNDTAPIDNYNILQYIIDNKE